jgi:hypothetical protein
MNTKEQILDIVKNSPEKIWRPFYSKFGYDNWCIALKDVPEAQPIFMKRAGFEGEIDDWGFEDRAEEERSIIIASYFEYASQVEKDEFFEHDTGDIGQKIYKRILN